MCSLSSRYLRGWIGHGCRLMGGLYTLFEPLRFEGVIGYVVGALVHVVVV